MATAGVNETARARNSALARVRRVLGQPTARVLLLSSGLVVLAVALYAVLPDQQRVATPFTIAWWQLALGFAAAEAFVIHLQFRREVHSISLSEIPVLVALVFGSPGGLVLGYLVGAGLALGLHRRQAPLKLVFNLSHFALEATVASFVFRALLPSVTTAGISLWAATLAAVAAVDAVSVVSVTLVIAVHQGRLEPRQLLNVLGSALGIGTINTALALIAVTCLWNDASSWVLLSVGVVIVVLAYRAYASLRERHASLELLYEFTRVVGRSPRAEEVMLAVCSQARELLRGETAELVFASHDDRYHRVTLAGEHLETHECRALPEPFARAVAENRPVVVPRTTRDAELRDALTAEGWKDVIVAPLRAEQRVVGVIAVSDRLGDVSTFDEDDARLFELISNHASVALENGRLVDRLRHEALHDALTGLPNRTLFNDRVAHALATASHRQRVAVMLMDLDRFKDVNDSLGHHNGDLLLQEVASRLRVTLPSTATIARLGGDEFAVLVPDAPDRDIAGLATRLRAVVQQPFAHDDMVLDVGATIGVALWPIHGTDASTLLRRADVAMYAAKGTNEGFALYDPALDEYSPRRLALVGELRQAIADADVTLHYQPKVRLATGELAGVEALARWNNDLGAVAPDEFIPLAERTGLIGPLTTHVLREAVAQCAAWQRDGLTVPIAVNLSARSLLDATLPGLVGDLLAGHGVPAELLTLEVTESTVMSDPSRTIGVLTRLADMGLSIAVDDFGTGYSSLSYLKRLPVTEVKIDKSFVLNMSRDHNDATIVRSIIDLGQNLGLTVVAEGVEDAATWDELVALGCDTAQGFYLSRPRPAADLTPWLRKRRATFAATGRP